MGLLLRRLMSMDRLRRRRRCKIQARNGFIASEDKHKVAPSQQDDRFVEREPYILPYLPEEIWRYIHSLMPLRDAARAACVCRAFVCSWRSFPNLTFSNQTLGVDEHAHDRDEIARDFISKVDHIMMNHLGPGMRTLKLLNPPRYIVKHPRYIDSCLEKAITQGIEELTLDLVFTAKKYKLPCSILLRGNRDSIRYLSLSNCAFHPTEGFNCLRSLVVLYLFSVHIKGDELGCLLANSLALESLTLGYCPDIVYVKIPSLPRLNYLSVNNCSKLQVIESKAPNLSTFYFTSCHHVHLSLGKTLHVKKLYIDCSRPVCYSHAELASTMPNLEAAGTHSNAEMRSTSLVSSKLLYLEYLSINLKGLTLSEDIDCFSMVSSPSLDAFISDVSHRLLEHPSYDQISCFSEARTWVYLTCHMLKAWLS